MKAQKIRGRIEGVGIEYYKFVEAIPQADKDLIKQGAKDTFFYIKLPKKNKLHYTQTGYKIVTYNHDRYEFYHREPTLPQLIAILRKEKRVK